LDLPDLENILNKQHLKILFGRGKLIFLLRPFLRMGASYFKTENRRMRIIFITADQNDRRVMKGNLYIITTLIQTYGGGVTQPIPRDGGADEFRGNPTVRPRPKI